MRPMSEAPRDGTWVVCHFQCTNDPIAVQWERDDTVDTPAWCDAVGNGFHDDTFTGWLPLPSGDGSEFAIYIIEEDEHDVHVSFADGFRARVATDSDIGMALLRIDAITRSAQKPPCSAPVAGASGRGTAEGDQAGRASEPPSGDGWTRVGERMPEPHARYLVHRDGWDAVCTPNYAMHKPLWVPMSLPTEGTATVMLPDDAWMSLPALPEDGA